MNNILNTEKYYGGEAATNNNLNISDGKADFTFANTYYPLLSADISCPTIGISADGSSGTLEYYAGINVRKPCSTDVSSYLTNLSRNNYTLNVSVDCSWITAYLLPCTDSSNYMTGQLIGFSIPEWYGYVTIFDDDITKSDTRIGHIYLQYTQYYDTTNYSSLRTTKNYITFVLTSALKPNESTTNYTFNFYLDGNQSATITTNANTTTQTLTVYPYVFYTKNNSSTLLELGSLTVTIRDFYVVVHNDITNKSYTSLVLFNDSSTIQYTAALSTGAGITSGKATIPVQLFESTLSTGLKITLYYATVLTLTRSDVDIISSSTNCSISIVEESND